MRAQRSAQHSSPAWMPSSRSPQVPSLHPELGKHVAAASLLPDGGVRLDLEWKALLGGRGYDEFRCAATRGKQVGWKAAGPWCPMPFWPVL